ncbi:MAG TPA: hypothetical protein VF505_08380, partial [Thermoanaerobaculia bacterium]
ALLGVSSLLPYAYDAKTGAITLMMTDAIKALKGNYHRAVVWATDTKSGKRIEATWTFKLPDEVLPSTTSPAIAPAQIVPATEPAAATSRRTTAEQIVPLTGGATLVTHTPR